MRNDKDTRAVKLFLEKHAARVDSDDLVQDIANEIEVSRTFVQDVLLRFGVRGVYKHQRNVTVTPEVIDRLRDALGNAK